VGVGGGGGGGELSGGTPSTFWRRPWPARRLPTPPAPAAASGAALKWWRVDTAPAFAASGAGGGSEGGEAALRVSFPCATPLSKLAALLSPRTRVVAVTHVSNLLGGVLDVRRLVALVRAAAPRCGAPACLAPPAPAAARPASRCTPLLPARRPNPFACPRPAPLLPAQGARRGRRRRVCAAPPHGRRRLGRRLLRLQHLQVGGRVGGGAAGWHPRRCCRQCQGRSRARPPPARPAAQASPAPRTPPLAPQDMGPARRGPVRQQRRLCRALCRRRPHHRGAQPFLCAPR
jgi:hypothetical protein